MGSEEATRREEEWVLVMKRGSSSGELEGTGKGGGGAEPDSRRRDEVWSVEVGSITIMVEVERDTNMNHFPQT